MERDPKWRWDKSMKEQDCHHPMSHSTRGKQSEAGDKGRGRKAEEREEAWTCTGDCEHGMGSGGRVFSEVTYI